MKLELTTARHTSIFKAEPDGGQRFREILDVEVPFDGQLVAVALNIQGDASIWVKNDSISNEIAIKTKMLDLR